MWPTIIIAAIIGVVVCAIIAKGIINKKKGKSSCSCGGGCGGCAMKGACHASTDKDK